MFINPLVQVDGDQPANHHSQHWFFDNAITKEVCTDENRIQSTFGLAYCCRLYGTVHARELEIQGFERGLMPWCWCGSALVPMNSGSFPSICSEMMFD